MSTDTRTSRLADISSPGRRTPEIPVCGQLISALVGYSRGLTPFLATASTRRSELPSVSTRWAWCSSRSTVAVARVLGMIVSKPDGCRLDVTATERRSFDRARSQPQAVATRPGGPCGGASADDFGVGAWRPRSRACASDPAPGSDRASPDRVANHISAGIRGGRRHCRCFTAGDESAAYRELIQLSDDLARETGPLRAALTALAPAPIDSRYDALLAAVAEHHLSHGRLPVPAWVNEPGRFLDEVWFVDDVPALHETARAQTPKAFARHGVFLAASELASV